MYCGDTSFFVDLFDPDRSHHSEAKAWYEGHADRPLFAPAVVKWELYRGGLRVGDSYTRELQRFTADIETVPLTDDRALEAARVEQETRADGTQLAIPDCLIAGIVRAIGGTIVTRDRDFDRVSGLETDVYHDSDR
jgi:tRNA(fMet)-specific endonuclease VapC